MIALILISTYSYKILFEKSIKGGLKAKEKEEIVFFSKKKKKKKENKKRRV